VLVVIGAIVLQGHDALANEGGNSGAQRLDISGKGKVHVSCSTALHTTHDA
jgi:hypothetical protein